MIEFIDYLTYACFFMAGCLFGSLAINYAYKKDWEYNEKGNQATKRDTDSVSE